MSLRSDLLHPDVVKRHLKKLRKAKTYLIYAATGNVEKNDEAALIHLKHLNDLEYNMKSLLDNINANLIGFDNFKATGIKDDE